MALLETRFDSEVLALSLGMNIILPEHPTAWDEPPAVLYLLHGLTDDHTIWSRRTSIERYASDYPLVIVMPDVYKSFYCDMAHGSDYWKFVSEELPMFINRWFNVSSDPAKTFVAGLSMGGYGAMNWRSGGPASMPPPPLFPARSILPRISMTHGTTSGGGPSKRFSATWNPSPAPKTI